MRIFHGYLAQGILAKYWLFLPLFLLFGLFSHYYFWQIGDDGYIYFRYVSQALDGHFGRWSAGLDMVEGYSSPLWFLLLTALSATGLSVVFVSKFLGLGCALITIWGTWRLGRVLGLSINKATLPCFILILITGFHYWSTSGLETPMVMAIVIWLAVAFVTNKNKVFWLASISLARPEGLFLLPLLLISDRLVSPTPLKIKSVMLASIPLLIWMIFRLAMYELPLPNTFYAKATGEIVEQSFRGLVYASPILLLWVVCWIAYFKNAQRSALMVLGLSSWLLSFVIAGGGDWMIHFRLLLPVIPLVVGVAGLWLFESKIFIKGLICVAFLPLVLIWVLPKDTVGALQGSTLPEVYYQEGEMTRVSIDLAEEIRNKYNTQDLVIAVNHAGALPYALNESIIIDMVGLNNKAIAKSEGLVHEKYDHDYVLSLKPDLIVLNTRTDPGVNNEDFTPDYWSGETALVNDPRFLTNYQFSGLQRKWHWEVSMPYKLIYPGFARSWIVVFEKKP